MPSDEGYRTVEGNARKRRKISRTQAQDTATASTSPSPNMQPSAIESGLETDGITLIAGQQGDAAPTVPDCKPSSPPCLHELSNQALQSDLSAMRDLVTCKVCLEFLYEPYLFACGHTFCYTCIKEWVGQQKKTCPDCRSVIRAEPTPSYLIRELVLIFIRRAELLPDGETVERLQQAAKDEANAVAADKANTDPTSGGLFGGVFARRAARLVAIRDHEDNVWRCPECHHEVEDGRCEGCDARVVLDSDEDDDLDLDFSDEDSALSEELDHDLDTDDIDAEHEAAMMEAMGPGPWMGQYFPQDDDGTDGEEIEDWIDPPNYNLAEMRRRHARFRTAAHIDDEAEDDEDDDEDEDDLEEDDPELARFIVGDNYVEHEDDSVNEGEGRITLLSDSEEDDHVEHEDDGLNGGQGRITLSSDSEEDDDAPIISSRRVQGRPGRPRHITIDSDEDETSDSGSDDLSEVRRTLANAPPLPYSHSEDDSDSDASDESSIDERNSADDDSIDNSSVDDAISDGGEHDDSSGVPSSATLGAFSPLDEAHDQDDIEDESDASTARWGAD